MSLWSELSELGLELVDASGQLIGGIGDNIEIGNQNALTQLEANKLAIQIAKNNQLAKQRAEERRDKMIANALFAVFGIGFLALIMFFIIKLKK